MLPLWRSLRLVQGRFTKALNRRDRVLGPLWPGRYKSRLIDDASNLMQAIAYVHLSPVAAGITGDPASHRFSGHRRIGGRVRQGLVDVDEGLLGSGDRRTAARRAYGAVLGHEREAAWRRAAGNQELRQDVTRPAMDWLGVSRQPEPPKVSAKEVVRTAARLLRVSARTLDGRRRNEELGRVRELVMLVGVETFGMKDKDLAAEIGRDPGSASRLYRQATERRREDPPLAALVQQVVEGLRSKAEAGATTK